VRNTDCHVCKETCAHTKGPVLYCTVPWCCTVLYCGAAQVIAVDEAQFFPDLAAFVTQVGDDREGKCLSAHCIFLVHCLRRFQGGNLSACRTLLMTPCALTALSQHVITTGATSRAVQDCLQPLAQAKAGCWHRFAQCVQLSTSALPHPQAAEVHHKSVIVAGLEGDFKRQK
jgi:hypothetical protein